MIRVLDLFCGTGGISFGLAQASEEIQLVAGVDADAAACETARANHPRANIQCRSIESIDPVALVGGEAIDLIVGGPPCQGFSSLRPSRGTTLDDPRNQLFREYARFVGELRPAAFLMENVVGIVNATRGELLSDLLTVFDELGYSIDWRILNAASYGVPQKRERFFLLGVRHELQQPARKFFPQPGYRFVGRTIGVKDRSRLVLGGTDACDAISAWDAISDLPSLQAGQSSDHYRGSARNEYQKVMRAKASQPLLLHTAARHNPKMLEVIRHAGSSKAVLPEGLVTSGYSSCYSRIAPDSPSPTITVKFTSPASSKCIHPHDDRAITPREAARLQSFPDHFIFCGSKTEIAHQIGNAVPPRLAAAFAPGLVSLLGNQSRELAS